LKDVENFFAILEMKFQYEKLYQYYHQLIPWLNLLTFFFIIIIVTKIGLSFQGIKREKRKRKEKNLINMVCC